MHRMPHYQLGVRERLRLADPAATRVSCVVRTISLPRQCTSSGTLLAALSKKAPGHKTWPFDVDGSSPLVNFFAAPHTFCLVRIFSFPSRFFCRMQAFLSGHFSHNVGLCMHSIHHTDSPPFLLSLSLAPFSCSLLGFEPYKHNS